MKSRPKQITPTKDIVFIEDNKQYKEQAFVARDKIPRTPYYKNK